MYTGEQCSGGGVGDGACGDSTHPILYGGCVFFPYPFHEMGLGMGPDNLALCVLPISVYGMALDMDPDNLVLCVLSISILQNGSWYI